MAIIAHWRASWERTGWGKVGTLLVFLACFFLLLEWQERDYATRGENVEGVVVDKGVSLRPSNASTGTRRDHWISYRFAAPDGQTFEGKSSDVLLETWEESERGSPVTIQYKRDFPATNRIEGQIAGAGFWWKAAAAIGAIGTWLIIVGARKSAAGAEVRSDTGRRAD